jgi:hypothetical protein
MVTEIGRCAAVRYTAAGRRARIAAVKNRVDIPNA